MSNFYVNNFSQELSSSTENMAQSLRKSNYKFESMVEDYSGSLMKKISNNNQYKAETHLLEEVSKKNRSLYNYHNFDFVSDALSKQNLISQHFDALKRNVQRQTNKINILEKRKNKLRSHEDYLQSINMLNIAHDRYIQKFKELDINYLKNGYDKSSEKHVYNLGSTRVVLPLDDKHTEKNRIEVHLEQSKY